MGLYNVKMSSSWDEQNLFYQPIDIKIVVGPRSSITVYSMMNWIRGAGQLNTEVSTNFLQYLTSLVNSDEGLAQLKTEMADTGKKAALVHMADVDKQHHRALENILDAIVSYTSVEQLQQMMPVSSELSPEDAAQDNYLTCVLSAWPRPLF